MSSNDNSSTAKSYVDQATGAAQSLFGQITGNTGHQNEGEITKAHGETENAASHTVGRLGNLSADPNTGAVAKDNEDRTSGSWNQTVGSAKESIGNLVGSQNLRQQGIQQNQDGKAQEAKGQLSDFGSGIQDRAQGALGNIGSAVLGDHEQQIKYQDLHDEGKTRQRGAEADIQKQAGN